MSGGEGADHGADRWRDKSPTRRLGDSWPIASVGGIGGPSARPPTTQSVRGLRRGAVLRSLHREVSPRASAGPERRRSFLPSGAPAVRCAMDGLARWPRVDRSGS
eukprot:2109020-Prymnesium_polylepis.1